VVNERTPGTVYPGIEERDGDFEAGDPAVRLARTGRRQLAAPPRAPPPGPE
jgi:hypothetical protein